MAVQFERESAAEWMDTPQHGVFAAELPPPNEDYAYTATKVMHFWPVVNSKGATYFPEDIDDDMLATLVGKQTNLEHDKTKVVGRVLKALKTTEGVEGIIEIDKEMALLQSLDVDKMSEPGYFDSVSIELTRDPSHSHMLVYDDGFNIARTFPTEVASDMGIKRTTSRDPYRFQGKRVAERIKPARFTGLGLTQRPADHKAVRYAMVADDHTEDKPRILAVKEMAETVKPTDHTMPYGDVEYADPGFQPDKKKRYPLDNAEHVTAADDYFGKEVDRDKYSTEQRAHIDGAIARAKKRFNIGEPPKENAGEINLTPDEIKALQEKAARVVTLEAEIATLKETASAADVKLNESETKRKEVATELLVRDLEAIKPCKDDAERASLKETAAMACDDAGRIHVLTIERKNEKLIEQNAELQSQLASKPAEVVAPAEKSDEEKAADAVAAQEAADKAAADAAAKPNETASEEIPAFDAAAPKLNIAPMFAGRSVQGIDPATFAKL